MLFFCATDAGGARELLPVIAEAKKLNLPLTVLGSDVTIPILGDAEKIHCTSATEAAALLQQHHVTAVIMGTTGVMSPERWLIVAARTLGIRSVVVLDEWYNYALRFADEAGQLGMYLPDVICVQDEKSAALAAAEGLPKDILTITGSPSLAEYTKRAREFSVHPPARPAILGEEGAPTLLFLSQPLRSLYGSKKGDSGPYGPFLGFHEDIVRQDIVDVLSKIPQTVTVIEKLHPSEPEKSPPQVPPTVTWKIEREKNSLWPLLWHADVIVGMNTKALLEAAILGRRGISYQPDALRPMLCTAALLGLAELQTTKANLAERLPERLLSPKPHLQPLELPCAPADAAAHILTVAASFED